MWNEAVFQNILSRKDAATHKSAVMERIRYTSMGKTMASHPNEPHFEWHTAHSAGPLGFHPH
jgi:hypothetical protein